MYSRCSHLGPLAGKLRAWSRVHEATSASVMCAKPPVSLSDIPFYDAKHHHPRLGSPPLDPFSRPL